MKNTEVCASAKEELEVAAELAVKVGIYMV